MPYTIKETGVLRNPANDDLTDARLDAIIVETEDDAALTEDELAELRERFDFGRCGCSHDCCGHRYGGVSSITAIWPGYYIVLVRSARNY